MIPFLAVTVMLTLVGFRERPAPPPPPCAPDTVYFHIKTRTDHIGSIPIETVDTTWVIRSSDD